MTENYEFNDFSEMELVVAAQMVSAIPEMIKALKMAYTLILHDYQETDPTRGVLIDSGAEPTWNAICEALSKVGVNP